MRLVGNALVLGAALTWAAPAVAQCNSNASSCVSCHEAGGKRPVLAGPLPWHRDHGFGDLCVSCHAGDPAAPAKEGAHVGRRRPLADAAATCGGCHEGDASARAARYLPLATGATAPPSAPEPPTPTPPRGASGNDGFVGALAALLGIPLVVVLRRELALPGAGRLRSWLSQKTWSPYGAGVLLGLVVAISEVGFGRPLAAAGAFDKLAAYPGRWLFPSSQYYRHVMSPGITWQVWVIVGVLAGAFASSRLSGQARLRWLPDTQWQPRFGSGRLFRLGVAFVGAALVQIGAGIAGGCTSGLAISGGAVLSPAAFLFIAGMFAGGMATARLWYRGRRPS